MEDELKALKPNDEVYIKSWDVMGKVVRARPGDINEPQAEKLYQVQIVRYFERIDLELYDREAERQKRSAALAEKEGRFLAAKEKVDSFFDAGGDLRSAPSELTMEYIMAANDYFTAAGYKPIIVPK